ncbi:hypothetical protein MJO29_006244 [Puccinia striiformis f. sp. tritici]|nr:hypothetical protein MJO29_006244 [Puccinia striiformis f. sp. tritici]
MVNHSSLFLLLQAATLITAPRVDLGQLYRGTDNLGQSWRSMLHRYSDSVRSVTSKLKKSTSAPDLGSAKRDPELCVLCQKVWYDQGFFGKWPTCTHPYRDKDEVIECPICFEDLNGKSEIKQWETCNHFFHTSCGSSWRAKATLPTCPMCRSHQSPSTPPPLGEEALVSAPSVPSTSGQLPPQARAEPSEPAGSQLTPIQAELSQRMGDLIDLSQQHDLHANNEELSAKIGDLMDFCHENGIDANLGGFSQVINDLLEHAESQAAATSNSQEGNHRVVEHARLASNRD